MDESHHLNTSGAKKVTDYMGRYLSDNYDIEDKRDSEEYSFWKDDYDEYKTEKIEWLREQQDNWSYLAILNDRDFYVQIYANEDSDIYSDEELVELIYNIDVYGSVDILAETSEYMDYNYVIEVYDSSTGALVDCRKVAW
jgi:hypothetical protein